MKCIRCKGERYVRVKLPGEVAEITKCPCCDGTGKINYIQATIERRRQKSHRRPDK